jgi:hypothetical protein
MCSEDKGWDSSGMCEALSGGVYDVWFCFRVGQSDGEETKDRPLRTKIVQSNLDGINFTQRKE